MTIAKKLLTKYNIFYFLLFAILSVSYLTNVFHLTDEYYRFFDRGDESNIISRLLMDREQGFMSKGGMTGAYSGYNYNLEPNEDRPYILQVVPNGDISKYESVDLDLITSQRYDDFIHDRKTLDGNWVPYKTQPGGQAWIYSLLDTVLPINSSLKLHLFRIITVCLTSLVFVLFTKWVNKNFGFIACLATFILLFLSPWFFRLAYNLWWALWSFYIPFIVLTLFLQKTNKLNLKFYLLVALTLFAKFIFTGAEFISTTLVMSICPIIFFLIYRSYSLKDSFICLFKSSFAALFGVLMGFIVLVIQIRILDGNWMAGIEHIIHSFTKRSIYSERLVVDIHIIDMIIFYFKGDFWYHYLFPNFKVYYLVPFVIISSCSFILLFKFKKSPNYKKIKALTITCFISILSMLSWIVLFTEHAYSHYPIDFITWYMPYMLYGYAIIGVFIQEILKKKEKKLNKE